MKLSDIPNFSILYKLYWNVLLFELSKPRKSLSFTYTIFSFISSIGLKYLTLSFGIKINIFLIQGIFSKILLTQYFNSSLSSSFFTCLIFALDKVLSDKSIYFMSISTGSSSINLICSGFIRTSSNILKNVNIKLSDILSFVMFSNLFKQTGYSSLISRKFLV